MSVKIIEVPNIGAVSFQKRRGTRSIRLKIAPSGKIVVTMPYLVPYHAAVKFVEKHAEWVNEEQDKHTDLLPEGHLVGRIHKVRYIYDALAVTPKTRITATQIIIKHRESYESEQVQAAAFKAATRALKAEAKQFLPKRLRDIAYAEDYEFNGISLKQMRGRWGSCNQDKHITLNIFLMELPVELIDYVILHELAHTRALHHGPEFWQEFEAHLPGAKLLRRKIRQYQPTVPAKRMA
jgi:predicted metal-dependent hydrolase